jgi:hypothetical protein
MTNAECRMPNAENDQCKWQMANAECRMANAECGNDERHMKNAEFQFWERSSRLRTPNDRGCTPGSA